MWRAEYFHWLHASNGIMKCQPMETESDVLKVFYVLEAEAVQTAVLNLKKTWNVLINFTFSTEYAPDSAHFRVIFFINFALYMSLYLNDKDKCNLTKLKLYDVLFDKCAACLRI